MLLLSIFGTADGNDCHLKNYNDFLFVVSGLNPVESVWRFHIDLHVFCGMYINSHAEVKQYNKPDFVKWHRVSWCHLIRK